MKTINRSIVVAIVATIIGVVVYFSACTTSHANNHASAATVVDSTAIVDTFTCFTKYIVSARFDADGSKASIVYDDPDAGFCNQVIIVATAEAKYLVSAYLGQDVTTNLIIIQKGHRCVLKTD